MFLLSGGYFIKEDILLLSGGFLFYFCLEDNLNMEDILLFIRDSL